MHQSIFHLMENDYGWMYFLTTTFEQKEKKQLLACLDIF